MTQHPTSIGVFDSGVGGLTVLRAIAERLPAESTIYLGDTARVPYGTKSAHVVTRYALRVVEHLARHPLKALVVACNTASSVALPALREAFDLPVLGVVEPGAACAAQSSPTGRIAVLATEGTIRSGAYESALAQLAPAAQVVARPCPMFVPLVEEGLVQGPIADLLCQHYLADLAGKVDTAILGCTHYPLMAPAIASALGPGVRIVDSAEATAQKLELLLSEHDLQATTAASPGTHQIFFTDSSDRNSLHCQRFFGRPVAQLGVVDL